MSAETSHAVAAPPAPGGAATGVVPDIAAALSCVDSDNVDQQIRALDMAAQQLRGALDATRS